MSESSRRKDLLKDLSAADRWALAIHTIMDRHGVKPAVIALVAECSENRIVQIRRRQGSLPGFEITAKLMAHYRADIEDILFPHQEQSEKSNIISITTRRNAS